MLAIGNARTKSTMSELGIPRPLGVHGSIRARCNVRAARSPLSLPMHLPDEELPASRPIRRLPLRREWAALEEKEEQGEARPNVKCARVAACVQRPRK